jgi:hypothetical protein
LVCCPKTVSSLKDPSKRVNTKEAIIILISDFGRDEIRTGDSWDEIAEKVHRETKVPSDFVWPLSGARLTTILRVRRPYYRRTSWCSVFSTTSPSHRCPTSTAPRGSARYAYSTTATTDCSRRNKLAVRVAQVSAPVEELVGLLVRQLKEHPAAKHDNIIIKRYPPFLVDNSAERRR